MTTLPTSTDRSQSPEGDRAKSCTSDREGSSASAVHEPGVTNPSPKKRGIHIVGGNKGSSETGGAYRLSSSQQSTSSTEPSAPHAEPTGDAKSPAAKQVGRVVVQAALVAEIHLDVEVDVDGLEAEMAAQEKALESRARVQWDIVSKSAASGLRRHLIDKGHAAGLLVMRQISCETPELLVKHLPDED